MKSRTQKIIKVIRSCTNDDHFGSCINWVQSLLLKQKFNDNERHEINSAIIYKGAQLEVDYGYSFR